MAVVTMEYIGWTLVIVGCIFNIVSAFGCIKMPDPYTKLHAASITDSFGAPLCLLGLVFINGVNLVSLKILILVGLLFLITPTVTNALINSCLEEKIRPLGKIKLKIFSNKK